MIGLLSLGYECEILVLMSGLGEPSLYSVTGTTALTDSLSGTGQRRLSLTLTRVGLIAAKLFTDLQQRRHLGLW